MVQATEERRKTTELLSLFPLQGEWTEEDYFNLPETNHIVELSEGRLIVPEMPTTLHQRIIVKLLRKMADFVDDNELGEVGVAALPVRLWKGKIREPDIIFMSDEHKDRIEIGCWGVPDLAVEVISKSNEDTDRIEKFSEYAKAGIQEYWIVEPEERTIEIYILDRKKYKLLGKWGIDETARSEMLAGFEVKVKDIIG